VSIKTLRYYDEMGLLKPIEVDCFTSYRKARMIGPPMAIYHDPEFKERDWDIEVCMPIADELAPTERVKIYSVPGFDTVACVVYTGPFATIGEAYDALAKWIDEHGYRIAGPGRELNLRVPEPLGNQNDPNTVNEIQFPVEKV
jgi:effector-binding domain-containing protein